MAAIRRPSGAIAIASTSAVGHVALGWSTIGISSWLTSWDDQGDGAVVDTIIDGVGGLTEFVFAAAIDVVALPARRSSRTPASTRQILSKPCPSPFEAT